MTGLLNRISKRLRPEARVVGVDGSAGLGLLLWRSFPRIFQIIGAGLMLDFKRVAKKWAYFHKVPDFIRFFGREIFLRKMLVARPMPGGITLTELFQSYGPVPAAKPDVFVKIDIEGAEYAVLREVGPLLGRISCLVVEFHDLANHWDGLLDTAARLAPDFAVAHVHGNNYEFLLPGTGIPNALEVTWLNRQLAPAPITPSPLRYPLADLDQPCNARAPDYELNFD